MDKRIVYGWFWCGLGALALIEARNIPDPRSNEVVSGLFGKAPDTQP